jgi:hypothetical protein
MKSVKRTRRGRLERAQEIDDFLLFLNSWLIEVFDNSISLAIAALVSMDRVD